MSTNKGWQATISLIKRGSWTTVVLGSRTQFEKWSQRHSLICYLLLCKCICVFVCVCVCTLMHVFWILFTSHIECENKSKFSFIRATWMGLIKMMGKIINSFIIYWKWKRSANHLPPLTLLSGTLTVAFTVKMNLILFPGSSDECPQHHFIFLLFGIDNRSFFMMTRTKSNVKLMFSGANTYCGYTVDLFLY